MTVFDPRWGIDDRPSPALRPVTRRRFLGLVGVAGLAAYFAARGLSVPEEFLVRTVESPQPTFDPSSYRLEVDGLVQSPLSFTYQELLSLPMVSQRCDFLCIEGWGVDGVPWEGVQLGTLMAMAQPLAGANFVTFHCLGETYQGISYTENLSLEQAELPSALLAYCMYGQYLPPEHGSPLRLVFPRMRGYKGAKWVTRMEFTAVREGGYWSPFYGFDPWVEDEQPCSDFGGGPSCRAPVGGVAELLLPGAGASVAERGSSRSAPIVPTGLAAGGALLLGASTWYVNRRRRQSQKQG